MAPARLNEAKEDERPVKLHEFPWSVSFRQGQESIVSRIGAPQELWPLKNDEGFTVELLGSRVPKEVRTLPIGMDH